MDDTALTSQDSNRPSSCIIDEDFGESLDRIGLKIKSLQNELSSYTGKKKPRTTPFRDIMKVRIPPKEKGDVNSKENRVQTPCKTSRRTTKTPRTYSKGVDSTFRSQIESTIDISQSFGNIETQENDDEVVILQEVREKLQRIFQFYCRFIDKGSPFQLRLSKYRKMMTDSGLVEYTSLEDLEVLFLGHNQHKTTIEFEAFLKLLPKIACTRYPLSSYTPNQGLHLLLARYILPLNNQIESVSDLYNENGPSTLRDEPMEESVLIVLKSVSSTLAKIYREFFSWEIKGIENSALLAQNDENAFWTFLKEFEICPGMITKATGQSLWSQREKSRDFFSTIREESELGTWFKKKDIGVVFKFTKFCEVIINLSIMVYKGQGESSQVPLNEAEQVAALLGKLQYSRGMTKFALKGNLIVPKDVLEKVVNRQNTKKDKLWLYPNEDGASGKERSLNAISENKSFQFESGTQRNKIFTEIQNRILSQRLDTDT